LPSSLPRAGQLEEEDPATLECIIYNQPKSFRSEH
jgi:hypothetical protein